MISVVHIKYVQKFVQTNILFCTYSVQKPSKPLRAMELSFPGAAYIIRTSEKEKVPKEMILFV